MFKFAAFVFALIVAPVAFANPLPTPEQTKTLDWVQNDVNSRIRFQPESGNNDNWQIPTAYGDCEDFALLKRQELIDRGWNADDLKIILVYRNRVDDTGALVKEGHAVLWVQSINYVLDSPIDANAGSRLKTQINVQAFKPWADRAGWKFKCVFGDISLGDKHRPVTERCAVYGNPQ